MDVTTAPVRLPGARRCVARIAGLGAARPAQRVAAAELVAPFGKSVDWLLQRTGIAELRRLCRGESLLALATDAARHALADAGVSTVDTVVGATCSTREPLAASVAGALSPRAAAFDVNAACAGFGYALATAGSLVETGAARRVLVVAAEQMSALVDPADLGTSILFGDGAGAAVVTASEATDAGTGIGAPAWSSNGAETAVLHVPDGGCALHMDGRAVFRWAVDEVHKVAAEAIARAGLRPDDIEVFVPHQANLRIVEAVARKLGLHRAETATDVVRSGNTSAASIPLALDALRRERPHVRGRVALLAGFGAGLTIVAQAVRVP